jgi:hypothetical protein
LAACLSHGGLVTHMQIYLPSTTGVDELNGVTSAGANMAADNLCSSHAYCEMKVDEFL